jgi:hypothetical protein
MLAIQTSDLEELKDRKVAIATSTLSILIFILITFFTTFFINPPLPADVPPLKSDEVIEEFMIDNVKLQQESGGSGGGTPSNDKVDVPKPQSEKYLTQQTSDTKLFSGQSNNNTANNSNNTSSTTQKSDNPFGTGGDGGGQGSGSGGKFGNDQGTGGAGPGGNGNGEGRIRLNDPKVDQIKTNVNVIIYLKLTVNAEGNVVSAVSTSKTTTTDQRIINQVIAAVKSQVKYNKDAGSGLVTVFTTVRINAT